MNLRPHGLAAWLGAPVHELTGKFLAVDSGDVMEVGTLEARLLARTRASDLLVAEAARQLSGGTRDIAAVARDCGIGTRQLERRFLRGVGLPPKLYARMRRFQSVFAGIESGNLNWAAKAAACGYYDQAHLIRDFREFAGDPPAALLATEDLARHFLSYR